MWRTALCAVGGLSAACAAIYVSASLMAPADASTFEARFQAVGASKKADRLLPPRGDGRDTLVSFSVPAAQTSVVMKQPRRDDAAAQLHVQPVRTIPVAPIRITPRENAGGKDKLPVGCEPPFSPVTMPSMAHISSRCLS